MLAVRPAAPCAQHDGGIKAARHFLPAGHGPLNLPSWLVGWRLCVRLHALCHAGEDLSAGCVQRIHHRVLLRSSCSASRPSSTPSIARARATRCCPGTSSWAAPPSPSAWRPWRCALPPLPLRLPYGAMTSGCPIQHPCDRAVQRLLGASDTGSARTVGHGVSHGTKAAPLIGACKGGAPI